MKERGKKLDDTKWAEHRKAVKSSEQKKKRERELERLEACNPSTLGV